MKRILCIVCLCVASFGFNSSGFADTLDTLCTDNNIGGGVVAGSYPCFETSVVFQYKKARDKKDQTLIGKYYQKGNDGGISYFHRSSSESLQIWDTDFEFVATIDENDMLSGTMSISGHINLGDLATGKPQELMSADLNGIWGQNGNLLGFNTSDISCNEAINNYIGGNGCTENEVVYFLLDGIPGFGKSETLHGTAYTSVPLPPAVWLFGTGLLGLAGIARRRRKAA